MSRNQNLRGMQIWVPATTMVYLAGQDDYLGCTYLYKDGKNGDVMYLYAQLSDIYNGEERPMTSATTWRRHRKDGE
jgi:hypothetical protein